MKKETTMAKQVAAAMTMALALAMAACENDYSTIPSQDDVTFSADTLTFGDVLTGFSTPTGRIMLHNKSNDDVTIESIELTGGEGSHFGINIAGQNSPRVSDIRLRHGDSIFIFVNIKGHEMTTTSAMEQIEDHIVAKSGKGIWEATLTANILNVVRQEGTLSGDVTWDQDSIAYYVPTTLTIGQGAKLSIGAGVRILMGKNAQLTVEGELETQGSAEKRVTFRQLRSEKRYEDIPGQWDGIWLRPGSKATMTHTTIACCTDALTADTATLQANALTVRDASGTGIKATSSTVRMANALMANCGDNCMSLMGGDAEVDFCTLANYYAWDYRRTPTLKVHKPQSDTTILKVRNSIIVGNLQDEIEVDSLRENAHATFCETFIRTSKSDKVAADTATFDNCVVGSDAKFENRAKGDYHLKSTSAAVHGSQSNNWHNWLTDIEGVMRPRYANDQKVRYQMGAYETVPDWE